MHGMHGHYGWGARRMLWGLFLVILGTWWLLGELGRLSFDWSWAGPLAIVFAGVSMMMGGGRCWGCRHEWREDAPPEREEAPASRDRGRRRQ